MLPTTSIESLRDTVAERLAADDPRAAVDAVRSSWRTLAAESGEELREVLAGFGPAAWNDEPWLAAALGATHRSAGSRNGPAAQGYLEAAVLAADAADPSGLLAAELRPHYAAALRSLGRLSDAADQVALAEEAVDALPGAPVSWRLGMRASTALQAGALALHAGDFETAAARLELAEGMSPTLLSRAETVECLGSLALVRTTGGDFAGALALAAAAREAAGSTTLLRSCFGAPALVTELVVATERYRLDVADSVVGDAVAAAAGSDWEGFSLVLSARLHSLHHRHLEGLELLRQARGLYRRAQPSVVGMALAETLRAHILVRMGQGDEAWRVLAALEPDPMHELCPNRFIAQLRLANGDLAGAGAALQSCLDLGDSHAGRTLLDVQVLLAVIAHEQGDIARSALAADRALLAMARTGSRLPLMVAPPSLLRGVLADARERARDPEVRRIVDAYLRSVDGHGEARPEQLTERETAVLDQLRQGATVAGAASALFVSPNTVKTHLRSVYRKLGVASRGEAVRKAQTLGLYQITPPSPSAQPVD